MECGDYKGTIDFLDDFNRSQKTFKEFRNIINNITEESLSKVLDGDKVSITNESLFIETKKEKDQVVDAIKSIVDLININENTFNVLLNGALNKTRSGYIIIKH